MPLVSDLRLVAYALGAIGGALAFMEFFQVPSYVVFDEGAERWELLRSPDDVSEHTWLGRVGGLCLSLAFTLLFVAALL